MHFDHQALMGKKSRYGVYPFLCTVYYTLQQSGFRKELGFEMRGLVKRGLAGRSFPVSFLRAVSVEGFGKISTPYKGRNYIKYDGLSWGYMSRALGNRNNTLMPRQSAAVHRRHPFFSKGKRFVILDPKIYSVFGSSEWEVADTGGGLHKCQIDLFWGEDDPIGPGPGIVRPAGTDFQKIYIVLVAIPY